MGVPINEETVALPPLPPSPRRRRRLSQCCCGCSLRTGCVIIGTWTLINSLTTIYFSIATLGYLPAYDSDMIENMKIVSLITLLWGILLFASSLSLIYGADKKRTPLMKFWLCVRYLELVLAIGLSIYYLIKLADVSINYVFVGLGVFSLTIGIVIYTIAVVQSFCSDVAEEMRSLQEELFIRKL